MYIVAIAWIYVVLLMSLTETSVIAGIATFMVYGLAPLTLLLWLMGTPQRRRNRRKALAQIEEQSRDDREVEDGMRTGRAEDGAVRAEEDGAEGNRSILEPRQPGQATQIVAKEAAQVVPFSQTTAAIRPQLPSRR